MLPPRRSALTARRLHARLCALRETLLTAESTAKADIAVVAHRQRPSVRNFIHYLALRRIDLRPLQEDLAALGLSSLGRCEAHVLDSLESVIAALAALAGIADQAPTIPPPPVDFRTGPLRLRTHADTLFGASPFGRAARIMVTLPSAAATTPTLIDNLLAAGMELARINCAHDDATAWKAMIGHLKRASRRHRRPCPVLMDLGGPKLRTGAIAPGEQVVTWKPTRDHLGRMVHPAQILLVATGHLPPTGDGPWIPVAADWLQLAKVGDQIALRDALGRHRSLTVSKRTQNFVHCMAEKSAYVEPGTVLRLRRRSKVLAKTTLGALPPREQKLLLAVGDQVVVTADQQPGCPAKDGAPARIPCSLPGILGDIRPGERIWFDDGKIGGIIRAASPTELQVDITQAKAGGATLRADKGINLPDSSLSLPCLTDQDLSDLRFARQHADLIGLSFIRHAADIDAVLAALGDSASKPGLVLKIETPQAFAGIAGILLRALNAGPIGVMVARGDLAVEVGFARSAEVQEELLWLCEAAHVPVIWGTQVLETLAKKGLATRAEVTDAAMSSRAECVMLNKGPYMVEAVRFLADVLTRMHSHQDKKQTLLRRLAVSTRA